VAIDATGTVAAGLALAKRAVEFLRGGVAVVGSVCYGNSMSLAVAEIEVKPAPPLMTVEEYLEFEEAAARKHEYVEGFVYAMAGGRQEHSLIAVNAMARLHAQLRGGPCRVHSPDMKVCIRFPSKTRFYYPDCQVVCRPAPRGQTYQTEPVVIVEVLSESTRRFDEVEKWEAYLAIESLKVYILFEQKCARAVVWRRHPDGFRREFWNGLDATIPLPEIEASLSLSEVYEAVEFPPASEEAEPE
jgi:Uma2 family endonuclease